MLKNSHLRIKTRESSLIEMLPINGEPDECYPRSYYYELYKLSEKFSKKKYVKNIFFNDEKSVFSRNQS